MRGRLAVVAIGNSPMPTLLAVRSASTTSLLTVVQQAWDGGDAVLPLAPGLSDAAVTDLLRTIRPGALAQPNADPSYGLKVRHLPDPIDLPDDTALVVLTSGSTGQPTPVVLSHAALRASVEASVERLACAPGTPWLVCLPGHHVAGITAAMRSHHLGVAPIVLDRFDVDAVAGHADAGPWVSLVPTQLHRLIEAGVEVGRFAGILLGGAAAPADLLARARDAGARVVTSYGMTQTCGGCVHDGRPLDGVEVRATPEGLLQVRGDVLLTGVIAQGRVTDVRGPDGWFTTTDLGTVDVDGHVTVHGRADDVVVSGGENVPADRVAAVLQEHPAVVAAAVVGRPDDEWGHVAVAVVEVATGCSITLDEARDHVADALVRTWAPRDLVVVEALPRTTLGKVDRAALRAIVA